MQKFNYLLAVPPLSEIGLGRGLSEFLKLFFRDKKNCHPELVSGSYQRGISSKILDKIPKYQMLKQVQHDKLYNASHCKSKCAFTLAEVLITLTIIGVIAALTIPTLIKKYDEAATVSKVKKMYTTIANAVRVWQVENGCDTDVGDCLKQYGNFDCKNAFGGIEKKLDIVAHRYQNESVSNIKWLPSTNYGLNGTESPYSYQGVNNKSEHSASTCHYLFKNGTTMMAQIDNYKNDFSVFIDINGKKKPNRVGFDIFPIGIGSHNNKIKTVNPYYVEDNSSSSQGLCYYRNNTECNPDICTKTSCSPTAYVLKHSKLPPITW